MLLLSLTLNRLNGVFKVKIEYWVFRPMGVSIFNLFTLFRYFQSVKPLSVIANESKYETHTVHSSKKKKNSNWVNGVVKSIICGGTHTNTYDISPHVKH